MKTGNYICPSHYKNLRRRRHCFIRRGIFFALFAFGKRIYRAQVDSYCVGFLPALGINFVCGFFCISILASTGLAQAENIKIGVFLCLTGDCAEPGQNAFKGIQLGVEEVNNSGGVLGKKLLLSTQDTKEMSGAANSVTAFNTLLLEGDIHYIIGPTWTVGGLPVAPIAAKRRDIIVTSPSLGVADFNEAADHLFNTWPHDSISTKALAKYAVDRGWKRAAVFSNQGPWESTQARLFAEEFKRLGGEIVITVEPLAETRDIRTEVTKIKNSNPDVVFMSNYTQMDIAAKELRNFHYTGHKMAILMDETRLKNSEGALDGTIYARYPEPSGDFVSKFEKRYGEKPGIAADTGYDTLKLYAKAIEQAQTEDITTVKKVLAGIHYSGASGEIKFDGKGGVIKYPQFWIVRDSKQVLFEESK